MASSLYSNAQHVDFESVLGMDDPGMVSMFEALMASGLRGFLGCPAIVYEYALVDFFENASVRSGVVISTVGGQLVEISEKLFAETFELPVDGLGDLSEMPKDAIFDARSIVSLSGEPINLSGRKNQMKMPFRLLCDIVAKAISVKAGSFNAITVEKFSLMTVVVCGVKMNWAKYLFSILKKMVTAGSKQAKGFAIQISRLLATFPTLELGESSEFPASKILSKKTVLRFVSINDRDGAEEVAGAVKKKAVSKKRLAADVGAAVPKKKRSSKKKSVSSLELVEVAEEAIPIQQVAEPLDVEEPRCSSADAVDLIIQQVLDETRAADAPADITQPAVTEDKNWFDLPYDDLVKQWEAERPVVTASDTEDDIATEDVAPADGVQQVEEVVAPISAVDTLSADEQMTLDDILLSIPVDIPLPSTCMEVTKITMGKSIKIPGVSKWTWFLKSLPSIPVNDKGKQILVEKDPVKGNPAAEHYSLICADIDLLVSLRAQVIDEEARNLGLTWTKPCCSTIFEGSPRDRGAVIARSNSNTRSLCWIRKMILVDGLWTVELCADIWVKIPKRIISTEVPRQRQYDDTLPTMSVFFKLLRKRWADVCVEVVEFCASPRLLPIGSTQFCRSLQLAEPVSSFAPSCSTVFALRVSQFCSVFIDLSLFNWGSADKKGESGSRGLLKPANTQKEGSAVTPSFEQRVQMAQRRIVQTVLDADANRAMRVYLSTVAKSAVGAFVRFQQMICDQQLNGLSISADRFFKSNQQMLLSRPASTVLSLQRVFAKKCKRQRFDKLERSRGMHSFISADEVFSRLFVEEVQQLENALVDGLWAVELCADRWVKIPKRIISTEVPRQRQYDDTLPTMSVFFKLLRKRWADVCVEVVEFCASLRLLPIGSTQFCRSLQLAEPVSSFAPSCSTDFALRFSQFCSVFIDLSLFNWLPSTDISEFLSSIALDRTILRSVQRSQDSFAVAPSVQLSLDQHQSSSSSDSSSSLHFDQTDIDTTASSRPTISPDFSAALADFQAALSEQMFAFQSEISSRMHKIEKSVCDSLRDQADIFKNLSQGARKEVRTIDDVHTIRFNEFRKNVLTQNASIFQG
ncbi:hypothetical protein F511_09974 [Dorcoceras hygrometricum]|uniref:Dystroglycan-like n=1 Tax=Dorcoceras hygrometricum TaxID=472368 RepID=A0A2Z7D6I8_9LAMI|nr:hypothetical protein F511_09974 [Dorcoceras hygrometricum]